MQMDNMEMQYLQRAVYDPQDLSIWKTKRHNSAKGYTKKLRLRYHNDAATNTNPGRYP
jgi:hypothetical protein